MKGAPRSNEFDDVYFSAEDGLAETAHVFIRGNGLPEAWAGKKVFTIAETGFGTGLNFLSAFKLFRQTAGPGQRLHFISFEKYPLSVDFIREALSVWVAEFQVELEAMLRAYPDLTPGVHEMKIDERVTLRVIFGDVNEEMPKLNANVDCWFLDGFRPASNPEMWSETVFQNMGRVSKPGATFATFTAAGFVKRGLEASGFNVQKVRGFGRKRDMLVGAKR